MNEKGSGQFLSHAFTDLMASLAVIFILLTVVFIKSAGDSAKREKQAVKSELSDVLKRNSLPLSQDPNDPLTMSLRVSEETLEFSVNSDKLSPTGAKFVDRFAPELARELCSAKIRSTIDAIIIEGHTDKSGEVGVDGTGRNIRLSQSRSFSVLNRMLLSLKTLPELYDCILKMSLASGRGSSNPIFVNGVYDASLSRRVEIKIRVKSSEQEAFSKLKAAKIGP